MFAKKLSPLIASHPQEAAALLRLASYLDEFESRRGSAVYKIRLDPHRMFDILEAGSNSRLAMLITLLIKEHIISRELVVRFPQGNGVTFSDYSKIPSMLRDPVRDIDVEVSIDQVEPSYVLVCDERA